MSISISPEVAALLGAAIGALPSLFVTYIKQRSSERQHIREIATRSAIENWRFVAQNSEGAAPPLDHWILHAAKMTEVAFSDEKLTPEQLASRLEEIKALMDTLTEHAQAVRRGGNQ